MTKHVSSAPAASLRWMVLIGMDSHPSSGWSLGPRAECPFYSVCEQRDPAEHAGDNYHASKEQVSAWTNPGPWHSDRTTVQGVVSMF